MGTRDRNNRMSLLVRNLKFHTSPDRLRQIFERYGGIRDVYLPVDFRNKRPKGFGFVEYYSERDAQAALEATDQTEVDGNYIEVTHARRGRSSPGAMREREPWSRAGPRHKGGRSRSRSGSPRGGRGNNRGRRSSSHDRRKDRSSSRDYSRRTRDYHGYDDNHRDDNVRSYNRDNHNDRTRDCDRYKDNNRFRNRDGDRYTSGRDYDRRRPRDDPPPRDHRRKSSNSRERGRDVRSYRDNERDNYRQRDNFRERDYHHDDGSNDYNNANNNDADDNNNHDSNKHQEDDRRSEEQSRPNRDVSRSPSIPHGNEKSPRENNYPTDDQFGDQTPDSLHQPESEDKLRGNEISDNEPDIREASRSRSPRG